ncbi:hypothetical protein [Litorimonas sp. WD9-15]|uniref:hypothetical protein n=1 Tax=Litorimonas sp. WD9-15 TaxID=3418716 RepID=UPI003D0183BB
MSKTKIILTGLALAAMSASPVLAADAYISGGTLRVTPTPGLKNISLTVTGPDGYAVRVPRGTGSLSVNLMEGLSTLPDGTYRWRISGTTNKRLETPRRSRPSFGQSEADMNKPRYEMKVESGAIRVVDGIPLVIDRDATEED